MGSLTDKKDAAVYRLQEFQQEIAGHSYRFVVVHSSALDKRKEQSITAMVKSRRLEFEDACAALAKRSFFCEADAKKELEIFLKKHATPLFEMKTEIREEHIQKRGVGRPRKDEPAVCQVQYRAVPSLVKVNEQFVKELKAKASTFVLITNILDDRELSSADVLREYKNQTAVELSFPIFRSKEFFIVM